MQLTLVGEMVIKNYQSTGEVSCCYLFLTCNAAKFLVKWLFKTINQRKKL